MNSASNRPNSLLGKLFEGDSMEVQRYLTPMHIIILISLPFSVPGSMRPTEAQRVIDTSDISAVPSRFEVRRPAAVERSGGPYDD